MFRYGCRSRKEEVFFACIDLSWHLLSYRDPCWPPDPLALTGGPSRRLWRRGTSVRASAAAWSAWRGRNSTDWSMTRDEWVGGVKWGGWGVTVTVAVATQWNSNGALSSRKRKKKLQLKQWCYCATQLKKDETKSFKSLTVFLISTSKWKQKIWCHDGCVKTKVHFAFIPSSSPNASTFATPKRQMRRFLLLSARGPIDQ